MLKLKYADSKFQLINNRRGNRTYFMEVMFEWREGLNSQEWDAILSSMRGHVLQSAKWGDGRKLSDGMVDHRWVAFKDGIPVYLIRFEERRILGIVKIAWAPKGPVSIKRDDESIVHNEFLRRLKKKGYFLCTTNPWEVDQGHTKNSTFYTIWLDLTLGKERLWKNLHKQFRYDVRRATKLGVIVKKSKAKGDVGLFYILCKSLSRHKGFHFSASLSLMTRLLEYSENDQVESYVFCAWHDEKFCGGAFVVRCGENVHYMWAAVDRRFSHLSIGEAIQWEIIEWALSLQCKKYDLEGITLKQNDGVAAFKKKLGGRIVAYPGVLIYPLNKSGKLISGLLKIYLWLQPKWQEYKAWRYSKSISTYARRVFFWWKKKNTKKGGVFAER